MNEIREENQEQDEQDLLDQLKESMLKMYHAKKYEEAIEISGEILRIDPTEYYALYYRAEAYMYLGKEEDAANTVQQFAEAYPGSEAWFLLMGDLCLLREHYNEAVPYFEECLRYNPEEAGYHCKLAYALYYGTNWNKRFRVHVRFGLRKKYKSQINRAINSLLEAIRLRSDRAFYYRLLSYCYYSLEMPDQSFEHLKTSLILDPSQALTHAFLGQHYIYHNDLSMARSHVEHALAIDPECTEALDFMKTIEIYQQNPKVYYRHLIEYHKSICILYPKNAENWLRLANTKLYYGKDHPVQELKKYLKLKPDDWEMQFSYGKVLYDLRNYFLAKRHFRKLDRQMPGNPHIEAWINTLNKVSKSKMYLFSLWNLLKIVLRYLVIYPSKLLYHIFAVPTTFLLQLRKGSENEN